MSKQIFNLPDVGEGLTEADIVSWKVKPGDTVAINDVLCEIETAKSLVELPSPYEGTVLELLAPEHETIEVGSPIIAIGTEAPGSKATDDGGASPSAAPSPAVAPGLGDSARAAAPAAPAAAAPAAPAAQPAAAPAPPSVTEAVNAPVPQMQEPGVESGPLVGSGPKADAIKRRPRKPASAPTASSVPAPVAATPAAAAPPVAAAPGRSAEEAEPQDQSTAVARLLTRVLAKPPVRRIAKELGINLADVPATGARGEVTRADLESYQAQREREIAAAPTFWEPAKKPQDERVEVVPVRGVRKA
ncbi:MAG: 2-oxo acid dehydrogenase subunit E2, partial [Sinomonas sp.]|nr:2-oxo acid dehydrogenase subunit E2 [Sinomonas sp.]